MKATEGRTAANSKKGETWGREGRRDVTATDLLHVKIKCGECRREPEGSHFDTAVFFFLGAQHMAASSLELNYFSA